MRTLQALSPLATGLVATATTMVASETVLAGAHALSTALCTECVDKPPVALAGAASDEAGVGRQSGSSQV